MSYNKLKEVRKKTGMSVTELSRRSNVSRVTITKIENGDSNPTVNTIEAVSRGLNKLPSEIFFNNGVNQELHLRGGKQNDSSSNQ